MDWIEGITRAIDYIEAHLTEELDYERIARESFSSAYHFQRVFSILCGYTLGEYIRNRRLTLAGAELASGRIKVIDAALKYGYDSPDSFARAFARFHGVNPSQAHGAKLRSFSRLSIKISLEGGNIMDYKIVKSDEGRFIGFGAHFDGVPGERSGQESELWIHSRMKQYILAGMTKQLYDQYGVIDNIGDCGYTYRIASRTDMTDEAYAELLSLNPEMKGMFELFRLPSATYVTAETERSQYPTMSHLELRRRMITEWLPSSGYELAEGAELEIVHWFGGDDKYRRYIEVWLPVKKL